MDPFNSIPESDETNNTESEDTQVRTGIDLTVTKAADFDPVATSGTLTYTITVKNIGTQDSTGVVVRDTLPANSIFRVASADHNFTCSHSGGTVECISGILNGTYTSFPGVDTATITITVFAPPIPGPITNVVRVDPDKVIPEINEDNNINSLTTQVAIGGVVINAFNELTISQTDTPDPVAPSGVYHYIITIGNDATDPAFNVKVRDFLPPGSAYISAVTTGGFHCVGLTTLVECSGGTIQPGGSETIDLKVFAGAVPGTYVNQALVDPDNQIPEGNETNNTSNENTTVALGGGGGFIELHISSLTDAPDPVAPSGVLTYSMTVENTGTDQAFNVAVRNFLPAGTTFLSATGTGGFFCLHTAGILNCAGGSIPGGSSQSISITVFAPTQPGSITNQAIVDPDNAIPEADETNNAAATSTTVQLGGGGGFIDLTVDSLTDSPDPVAPGAQLDLHAGGEEHR